MNQLIEFGNYLLANSEALGAVFIFISICFVILPLLLMLLYCIYKGIKGGIMKRIIVLLLLLISLTGVSNAGLFDWYNRYYYRQPYDYGLIREQRERIKADDELRLNISQNNSRLDILDAKITELTDISYIAGVKVRVIDTKRFTIEAYNDYDTQRQRNKEIGVTVTYKLGKSYEERRIEKLEAVICELMYMLLEGSDNTKYKILNAK